MKMTFLKMLFVLFSFCSCFETFICASSVREISFRGPQRRSNYDRSSAATTLSPPVDLVQKTLDRLESTFTSISEKLENHEKNDEKIVNILTRLELLNEKIDKVEDKLFNDDISDESSLSINARLILWEKKINRLEEKLDEMKKRIDDNLEDSTNEPLHVKFCDDEQAANIAIIAQQMKELLETFEEKVEENFSSTEEKFEYLRRYLQILFDEVVQTNVLKSKNVSAPIRRTERRIENGTGLLINEIVTMVKTKLKPEKEEEDDSEKQGGSLTDIVSSVENMKSVNPTQKTKTTSAAASRKDGVIFPNVKNKPLKLNNTFLAEAAAGTRDARGFSCVELMNAGLRQSGVYYLQIRGTTYWFLKVFCEQEIADGGWTVIQRRDDFGEPRESFSRDWADYKNGFGDPAKEFWMGNENIFMLIGNEDYALRIELEDFEGNKRYAQYSRFKVHSEADYYKLEIDGYEGNAGDSLNDSTHGSNNSPFSTYNRDNDRSSLNCASMLKGGWWWKSCGRGLNGLYLRNPDDIAAKQGIIWFTWKGWEYSLKKATMMIKPLTKSMTS